jgi:hypothetical protein
MTWKDQLVYFFLSRLRAATGIGCMPSESILEKHTSSLCTRPFDYFTTSWNWFMCCPSSGVTCKSYFAEILDLIIMRTFGYVDNFFVDWVGVWIRCPGQLGGDPGRAGGWWGRCPQLHLLFWTDLDWLSSLEYQEESTLSTPYLESPQHVANR